MDYEKIADAIDAMSVAEQIRVLAKMADGDDYRLFSRAQVWAIEGHKSTENVEAIDAIILSAFRYPDAGTKVGILRSAFSARHCLKYWHSLRDNAHVHAQKESRPKFHMRMVGLYTEFRNAAVLFPRFTPRHSLWQNYPQEHLWPRPRWN